MLLLIAVSLGMATVVLIDISIPGGAVRFDRDAFYVSFPVAEQVTRNGTFCRQLHLVVFGFRFHVVCLDNLYTSDARSVHRSIGWSPR